MKRFRTSTLDQPLLLPPSLHDWPTENRLVRLIAEVAGERNLDPILEAHWRKDSRGAAGHHPEMLTRLPLYGCATGITNSRRIEKASYGTMPFRCLAAGQHPDHDTIANFRRQHLGALARLFVEGPEPCWRW